MSSATVMSYDIYYGGESAPRQELDPTVEPAPISRLFPLFDMESSVHVPAVIAARKLRPGINSLPVYPFANDTESARYYPELSIRRNTATYKAVAHPIAMIVGEGSLAAALSYLPEPTILLTDIDARHTRFMQNYVKALRASETREDFLADIGGFYSRTLDHERQVENWKKYGLAHPFESDSAFAKASQLARNKAFIHYNINLAQRGAVKYLAAVLEKYACTITFMNLTNLAQFDHSFDSAETLYKSLSPLPVAKDAPIMTTSRDSLVTPVGHLEATTVMTQTGPFWGLEGLRDNGDTTTDLNQAQIDNMWYPPDRVGALFYRQILTQSEN